MGARPGKRARASTAVAVLLAVSILGGTAGAEAGSDAEPGQFPTSTALPAAGTTSTASTPDPSGGSSAGELPGIEASAPDAVPPGTAGSTSDPGVGGEAGSRAVAGGSALAGTYAGPTFAYQTTANDGVWVKRGSAAPVKFTTRSGYGLTWSADGRYLAWTDYSSVFRVDTHAPLGPQLQSWSCSGCGSPVFTNSLLWAPTATGLHRFPVLGSGPVGFLGYRNAPPIQFPSMFSVNGFEGQADGVILEWADPPGSKGGPSKLYRVGLDGGFQFLFDNGSTVGLFNHTRSDDGRSLAFTQLPYSCFWPGAWSAHVIPANGGPGTQMPNAAGYEGLPGSIAFDRSGTVWTTQATTPSPSNCDSRYDLFRWNGSGWTKTDNGVVDVGFGPANERIMIRNAAAGAWNGTLVVSSGGVETTVATNVVGGLSVAPSALMVALGDSYASGEGAPSAQGFWLGTDTSAGTTNRCHRSDAAWPMVLARARALDNSFSFRACSGAVTADLTSSYGATGAHEVFANEPAQLDALSPATRLVTLSMGGNDIGFAPILQFCATSVACHSSPLITVPGSTVDRVDRLINAKYASWRDSFTRIKSLAPSAVVEVLLYPRIFPTGLYGPWCLPLFDPLEVAWFNSKAANLNTVLRAAAKAAGVNVIEAENALAPADVCSSPPGVNNLHNPFGSTGAWSFHPNLLGHSLLAGRVTYHYANPSPAAVTAPTPTSPSVALGLLNLGTGFVDYVFAGGPASAVGRGFAGGSSIRLTLNSTPTTLGTFTANGSGTATMSFTLPPGTSPGTHTLVAEGTAGNGDPVVQTTQVVVPGSPYVPVNPARIFDTRDGTGGQLGPLGPQQAVSVQVTGRGGVPASGVSAVVVNLTAVNPSASTHLTMWPSGDAPPAVSNLNVVAGQTAPNLVTVKVGSNGRVQLANNSGDVHAIVDVAGYYLTDTFAAGSRYQPLSPSRVLDTRDGTGGTAGAVIGGSYVELQVTGAGGVPATGVGAVALNVTGVVPTAATHLTVWPADAAMPVASNLNLPAGDVRANLVIARVGANGKVRIYNNSGATHVIADIAGYFTAAASSPGAGSGLVPVTPARILDTRDGTGAPIGTIGPGQTLDLQVRGRGGTPNEAFSTAVLNVTAVSPSATSHLSVWPTGEAEPTVSNVNFPGGQTRANQVSVKLGHGGQISIRNNSGTAHVLVDLAGWYT